MLSSIKVSLPLLLVLALVLLAILIILIDRPDPVPFVAPGAAPPALSPLGIRGALSTPLEARGGTAAATRWQAA